MILTAWRIYKREYAPSAFTGEGAKRFGGRFNSPGVPIIYTAATRSLAALEMVVHLGSDDLLQAYLICPVSFDSRLVRYISPKELPKNWRRTPADRTLQLFGDSWIKSSKSVVLQVPSSLIDGEYNFLLNAKHPHFSKITIGKPQPFRFDPRLT